MRASGYWDRVVAWRRFAAQLTADTPGSWGNNIKVTVAQAEEARHHYGIDLLPWEAISDVQALIIAVAHKDFREKPLDAYLQTLSPNGCRACCSWVKSAWTRRPAQSWR